MKPLFLNGGEVITWSVISYHTAVITGFLGTAACTMEIVQPLVIYNVVARYFRSHCSPLFKHSAYLLTYYFLNFVPKFVYLLIRINTKNQKFLLPRQVFLCSKKNNQYFWKSLW